MSAQACETRPLMRRGEPTVGLRRTGQAEECSARLARMRLGQVTWGRCGNHYCLHVDGYCLHVDGGPAIESVLEWNRAARRPTAGSSVPRKVVSAWGEVPLDGVRSGFQPERLHCGVA